jgi:hypothetical protein
MPNGVAADHPVQRPRQLTLSARALEFNAGVDAINA